MEEIWKDIPGFDFYQACNLGKIRSKNTEHYNPLTKGVSVKKGIELKSWLEKGYLRVGLSINSKHYYKYVHVLVALTFIPLIEGKKVINHIDGNPSNNNVKNLEWCTQKENIHHSIHVLKRQGSNKKRVFDEKYGVFYDSAKEAHKYFPKKVCLVMFRIILRSNKSHFKYA